MGIATIVILLTSEIGHLMHGTSVYPLTDTSSEVMVGMLFTLLGIIGVGLVGASVGRLLDWQEPVGTLRHHR